MNHDGVCRTAPATPGLLKGAFCGDLRVFFRVNEFWLKPWSCKKIVFFQVGREAGFDFKVVQPLLIDSLSYEFQDYDSNNV